jgi:hypothetical protein
VKRRDRQAEADARILIGHTPSRPRKVDRAIGSHLEAASKNDIAQRLFAPSQSRIVGEGILEFVPHGNT